MLRTIGLLGFLTVLGACADPLKDVDRLSDIDLAAAGPAAAALPTEAEVAREGFFGTDAARSETPVLTSRAPAETQPAPRRGLFGALRRAMPSGGRASDSAVPTGPDAQDVAFETVLPFGEVARSCAARGQALGQKIEKAAGSGFVLYDSAPGSAAPRSFYITGFDDGCPRKLTAANVLLGAPSLYERLHYGPGGENLPKAETDRVYDSVKRRVCGTGAGKPCGRKINQMNKSTVFVSAYNSFRSSDVWKELLIHDGSVVASALKTNN